MAKWVDNISLRGDLVLLEVLQRDHELELTKAVEDGDLHDLWFTSAPSPDQVGDYIDQAIGQYASGAGLGFAVRDIKRDTIVGSTRYLNIEADHRRLEIGNTWYSASAQRTGVNTECKYLLLRHAFENLAAVAVEFRTHWHNRRSRAAIERLGAKQDGVLRHHRILDDGSFRDTVVYSILAEEWPAAKRGLSERLQRKH